jgi:hypothetical protein
VIAGHLNGRVSFAAGMAHLGGTARPYARDELQRGRREAVRDAATVLGEEIEGDVLDDPAPPSGTRRRIGCTPRRRSSRS